MSSSLQAWQHHNVTDNPCNSSHYSASALGPASCQECSVLALQSAVGTSLIALLLPVGLLGVIEYYRSGKISVEDITIGLIIAAGLFAVAYFGAKIATHLSHDLLRKAFAVFMGIVAFHLWFK